LETQTETGTEEKGERKSIDEIFHYETFDALPHDYDSTLILILIFITDWKRKDTSKLIKKRGKSLGFPSFLK